VEAGDKWTGEAVGSVGLAGGFNKGPNEGGVTVRKTETRTVGGIKGRCGKRGVGRRKRRGFNGNRDRARGGGQTEGSKEGIVRNDEEERGKGATLLDAPHNGDIARRGATEEGGDLDIKKGGADEAKEPAGEGGLVEDLENPGVIDGVERLGRVEQENVLLNVISNSLVEELIEVFNVGMTVDAGKETFLSRVEESGDSGHDSAGDGAGQETIVSVSDTDRTGIRDQAGVFFGEQE